MERFLLYLDDLDDVVHALVFAGARRGRALARAILGCLVLASGCVGMAVAVYEPPLGAGIMALLSVLLLYRSATAPQSPRRLASDAG